MLIYLADLAHTYTTKNESLMVPLNIGYLKAYAMEQHKGEINIKLFKFYIFIPGFFADMLLGTG